MPEFNKHFRMSEQDAADYARQRLNIFSKDAVLSCVEIGDGNINYVFRIEDKDSGVSVILKQSDSCTRSGQTALNTDRSRVEAEVLRLHGRIAPGLVPEVYSYDPVMCCTVMQDLRGYENLRHALIAHRTFPTFAQDITTFLANVLIKTTDCVLTPREKKEMARRYISPDLCDITERLVYTEPYTNIGSSNSLFAPNEEFLRRELYMDRELTLEAAKLKEQFQSKAQSLLHGDLHTGSVFVREGSTMVLDPEFAFYGPAGYDIGNIIANLIFAWVNAEATMGDTAGRLRFQQWVEQTIVDIVTLFRQKAALILKQECTDVMAGAEGFADWFIADILTDTAGVAGMELNRRIIGDAKVQDIAGIEQEGARLLAERICVLCGKRFIKNRAIAYQNGQDYVDTIKNVRAGLGENGGPT